MNPMISSLKLHSFAKARYTVGISVHRENVTAKYVGRYA